MRKIFIFWIVFLLLLAAGVTLAVSSKLALRKEEAAAGRLKKMVVYRPSRLPKLPEKSETKVEEEPKAQIEQAEPQIAETPAAAPNAETAQPALPVSGDVPAAQGEIPAAQGAIPIVQGDIPVQINTDSLEIINPEAERSP